jgi:quercetin dioxygenase-like cupin family protein
VSAAQEQIQILSAAEGPRLPIVQGSGHAHAVVWPGMGARLRSIHSVSLESGAHTIELSHSSEAVYYVAAGSGEAIDLGTGGREPLREGSMVHVDPGTRYVLGAGKEGMQVVGGPAPPDASLYGGFE